MQVQIEMDFNRFIRLYIERMTKPVLGPN